MVPDESVLKSIYGKILNGHLEKFDGKGFRELPTKLINSLISFYN
jgi:hypothetical protein